MDAARPQHGLLLANSLLIPMGLTLFVLLVCATTVMLVDFPQLHALATDLGLGFLLFSWTAPVIDTAFHARMLGAALACAGLFTVYHAIWRWRRWGVYGLLGLVAFGLVFTGLGPWAGPSRLMAALVSAGRILLVIGLPTLMVLWAVLRPHWWRMR